MTIDVNNRESFRSNSVIRTEIDQVARTVTFHVFKQGSLTVYLDKMSQANRDYGVYHAVKHRVGDAGAIERMLVNGQEVAATPAAKFANMKPVVDHLNSGAETWRIAGGDVASEGTLLFAALMAMKPERDEKKLTKWLTEQPRAKRDALLIDPKVKPFVDAIRAERAKGVDTEGMFAELEAM